MKPTQRDKTDINITLVRWFIGVMLGIATAKLFGEIGLWISAIFILVSGLVQIAYEDKSTKAKSK